MEQDLELGHFAEDLELGWVEYLQQFLGLLEMDDVTEEMAKKMRKECKIEAIVVSQTVSMISVFSYFSWFVWWFSVDCCSA